MRTPTDIQTEANAAIARGAAYIRATEYESALNSLENARAMFEEIDDADGIVRAMQSIGSVYYYTGAVNEALAIWNEALDKNSLLPDQQYLAPLTVNYGNAMLKLGQLPEAMASYKRGLEINEAGRRDNGISVRALMNLGVVYYNASLYPDALEWWNRAMELQPTINDEDRLAEISTNLGNIHAALGSTDLALEYYDKAIEKLLQLNSRRNLARAYSGKAIVYSRNHDYDESVLFFKKAIELWTAMGVHSEVLEVTANLVDTLISAGRMDEARERLDILDAEHVVEVQTQLHIHLAHGWFLESSSDFEGAIKRYETALSIALATGYRAEESSAHQYLRDVARKQGDLDSYIKHNDAYSTITEEVSGKAAALKIAMIEKQNELLAIDKERDKERAILYSALPKHIADRMIRGEVVNDHIDNAAVMFLDIVGFTTLSSTLTSEQVIKLLDAVFGVCDEACKQNNVTKIKTIGDSYMAVAMPSLVPTSSMFQVPSSTDVSSPNTSSRSESLQVATSIANAALHIIDRIKEFDFQSLLSLQVPSISLSDSERLQVPSISLSDSKSLQVRIGLHAGPITAGVLGTDRLQYDVWGDTVNVASRLESTSEPNKIHVSEQFAQSLRDVPGSEFRVPNKEVLGSGFRVPRGIESIDVEHGAWNLEPRGQVEIKGKGPLTTYWLEQR